MLYLLSCLSVRPGSHTLDGIMSTVIISLFFLSIVILCRIFLLIVCFPAFNFFLPPFPKSTLNLTPAGIMKPMYDFFFSFCSFSASCISDGYFIDNFCRFRFFFLSFSSLRSGSHTTRNNENDTHFLVFPQLYDFLRNILLINSFVVFFFFSSFP